MRAQALRPVTHSQPQEGPSFGGAKAAFVCDGAILTYLRDDTLGLRFANWWDLPGGGREGAESPKDCLLREMEEEFGLRLPAEALIWEKEFPGMLNHRTTAWFFGGFLSPAQIAAIRFGDEGQRWEMMPLAAFRAHPRVIPAMRARAEAFLARL